MVASGFKSGFGPTVLEEHEPLIQQATDNWPELVRQWKAACHLPRVRVDFRRTWQENTGLSGTDFDQIMGSDPREWLNLDQMLINAEAWALSQSPADRIWALAKVQELRTLLQTTAKGLRH